VLAVLDEEAGQRDRVVEADMLGERVPPAAEREVVRRLGAARARTREKDKGSRTTGTNNAARWIVCNKSTRKRGGFTYQRKPINFHKNRYNQSGSILLVERKSMVQNLII
jgi:hypothetical protein